VRTEYFVVEWRGRELVGAPGFEPGNGGIKIR
jgi:hypothetical protein